MVRQSNQKDPELHKVKISRGLTAKKLIVTRRLKFFRSVTADTLRFFSLLLSGSLGFTYLLLIFGVLSEIVGLVFLDNKPAIFVLVGDFDQLLTLFDEQFSFFNQLVNISRATSTLVDSC